MPKSTILKICAKCDRIFDIITGRRIRKVENEWSKQFLKHCVKSEQGCIHCNKKYYAKLYSDRLETEDI